MITHLSLGNGFSANRKLYQLIANGEIKLAGNRRLRIYGTLDCFSGKRMKQENRVFFTSEKEAMELGFRCCKNCWCRSKKNHSGKNSEL
jgi:methylphosphotriester-DNA--protein-cysteine methyltransferase